MSSFDKNDRDAILAALNDPNPEHPIAKAIAERMTEFMANLEEQVRRTGKLPTELLLVKPSAAFDDIVIRLCLQEVTETLGQKIVIHWL